MTTSRALVFGEKGKKSNLKTTRTATEGAIAYKLVNLWKRERTSTGMWNFGDIV